MAVYVDPSAWQYGRMTMCHMVADDIDELFEMADDIGVARRHFQGQTKFYHFDICKAMRARAVKRGAIELTTREFIHKARAVALNPNRGKK